MGSQNDKIERDQSAAIKSPMTELTEIINAEDVWEEFVEISECCGIEYKKVTRKKLVWEDNFVRNCNSIRNDFKWVNDLIEKVKTKKLSRAHFVREVNEIKQEKKIEEETEREILLTPGEVEVFKTNLKRSVLLSFGHSKMLQDQPNRITSFIIPGRNSKIAMDKYNEHFRMSTIKREPSAMSYQSKSVLRKSILSFVDDTISSVFGSEKDISKQTAKDLQNFLKFTMLLEKHLNDAGSMLCQIKRSFVEFIEKNFFDPISSSLRLNELTDNVKQFLMLLQQTIIDYYNLNSFGQNQPHSNALIGNEENILSVATAILFKDASFYNLIFNAVVCLHKQREVLFANILQTLEGSPPEKFSVKDQYCLNKRTLKTYLQKLSLESGSPKIQNISVSELSDSCEQPYKNCMAILNQLSKSKTPIAKMKAIMICSERITKQISRFYGNNNLEMKQWVLDADQILSIFCYIIVGARVEHLHSHLFMLENFATDHQLISVTGYYYSVLTCALEQIENEFGKVSV